MNSQMRAVALKSKIEQACIECGLNLTVYDGKIGFVDQLKRKIVMVWTPHHHLSQETGEEIE